MFTFFDHRKGSLWAASWEVVVAILGVSFIILLCCCSSIDDKTQEMLGKMMSSPERDEEESRRLDPERKRR